jgi:hypothetical protein
MEFTASKQTHQTYTLIRAGLTKPGEVGETFALFGYIRKTVIWRKLSCNAKLLLNKIFG